MKIFRHDAFAILKNLGMKKSRITVNLTFSFLLHMIISIKQQEQTEARTTSSNILSLLFELKQNTPSIWQL